MKKFSILILIAVFFASCKKEDNSTQAEKDQKIIEDYIADNGISAQVTSSGLYYQIINDGIGNYPTIDSTVSVTYKGNLPNGNVFDEANTPITFSLRNVIEGWQEGIPLIREGGAIILLIPSRLGYRDQAVGSIPSYSVLIFEVNLIEVEP